MKQGKLTSRLVAMALCGAILMTPLYIYADDEDLTNQLTGIQQQMDAQNRKKADAETVIGTVSEQLKAIEEELNQAKTALAAIQKQRVATENEITVTQKKMEEAQKRLKGREAVFYKRVRDIYINGRLSYLDVVIGSKDFSDFANRLEILKRIIDSDINLLKSIKQERAEIEEHKKTLEADKAKIVELEKDAQAKQALIEKKKAERNAVLERAQNDKATAMAAIEELKASSAQISALIKQRQQERAAAASSAQGSGSAGYVQGTGTFSWPVNGEITSPYGYRIHPIWGTRIYHSGIDIGVDEGTPVHAADGGTVIAAEWYGGYGYAVVIDHGNGLSTLYGHNSELAVSAGQTVSKGQVIAYAGSTGNSTGPHVHFEVRVNGDAVDPMGYL